MNFAVETDHFSKSFGDVQAVSDISLLVKPGEIYGFLGLNGAGKTTTIRALLGMIRPNAGSIKVLGQTVGPNGNGPWGRVGHLVEYPSAYPDLTVRENLDVARRLHGIADLAVVDKVINRLAIGPFANRKAGTLSSGNLQRLGLARAMLHKPDLLILDEPISGLDPAGVVEIRDLLADLAHNHGVTVFMSSHILTEVDRLATHIGIIHEGNLIEDLDKDVLEKFRTKRLEVKARDLNAALAVLQTAGYVAAVSTQNETIILDEPRAIETPDEIAALLVRAGVPPTRLAMEQQNLEDHFMQLTGASK
jgi:ABC-2 type transport system ATP-binding protein